jgi:hypothetical protein
MDQNTLSSQLPYSSEPTKPKEPTPFSPLLVMLATVGFGLVVFGIIGGAIWLVRSRSSANPALSSSDLPQFPPPLATASPSLAPSATPAFEELSRPGVPSPLPSGQILQSAPPPITGKDQWQKRRIAQLGMTISLPPNINVDASKPGTFAIVGWEPADAWYTPLAITVRQNPTKQSIREWFRANSPSPELFISRFVDLTVGGQPAVKFHATDVASFTYLIQRDDKIYFISPTDGSPLHLLYQDAMGEAIVTSITFQ